MAKDAKGHGSEKRGQSLAQQGWRPEEKAALAHMAANPTPVVGTNKWGQKVLASARQTMTDADAKRILGEGNPKAAPVPVHLASRGLARGLSVDWSKAPNPHTGGSFAAQSRARRNDKAAAYVATRAARASNFKLR